MSLDPLFLDALLAELKAQALGAVVSKVHQPGAAEIVLRLWNGRSNLRLLLDLSPDRARLHFIDEKIPNPGHPPRFAQLLRSRLGRLIQVDRSPGQRVVILRFRSRGGECALAADLRGSRSDLLLLDHEGRVVDTLLRRSGSTPGALYNAPSLPPGRHFLGDGLPAVPPAEPFGEWLMDRVSPMSELYAADLQRAVEAGVERREALEGLRSRWLAGAFRPSIVVRGGKRLLCAWPPDYLELEGATEFDSPSAAAQSYYAATSAEGVFDAAPAELSRTLRKARRRLDRRLERIAGDREAALGSERQRELGDLLLANRHRISKGMESIVLDDWYADPPSPVTIELDPALSPQENVERYFRRHGKGRRALEHVERRRRETLAEIEWLEGIVLALEEAQTPGDVTEIRREMEAEGLLAERPRTISRPEPAPPGAVRQGVTPGGFTLFWGRNNRANDRVSRHLTAAGDLWFHALGQPGCHLVLKRRPGETVPEEDLLAAAAAAAAHSRGRDAAKVEVMVAEGRDVRKPKGARPGRVVVAKYRTVLVKPLELPSSPAST